MRRHLANCKLLDLKEVTGWDFLTCLNNLTFSFLYFTDLQRDWFSTEENRMQLWLSLDFQHIARYYLWRMWLIFTVLYVGLINGGVWKVLRGWHVYLAVQSTLYIYNPLWTRVYRHFKLFWTGNREFHSRAITLRNCKQFKNLIAHLGLSSVNDKA